MILDNSRLYNNKLKDILPGGVHYNFLGGPYRQTVHFKSACGSRLTDIDNNEYLDFNLQFGSAFLGHGNKDFNSALTERLNSGYAFVQSDLDYEVCNTLTNYIPCCENVRFSMSGTEAVQNAIRLSRAYTGKSKIIKFKGHYHGSAENTVLNISNLKLRPNIDVSKTVILDWNDIEALEKYMSENTDVACVIMEPFCLNGGGIAPKKGYLKKVRHLCDKYKVLLIFDEIITCVKTGLGGMQKLTGVVPDLCILGKSLGNAVPISAVCGRKDIMSLYTKNQVIHGGTFNGYPLGLSAVSSVFEILQNDTYYEKLSIISKEIEDNVDSIAKAMSFPLTVNSINNCLVLNCSDKSIQSYDEFDEILNEKNNILNQCLFDTNILLESKNRMYMNISLTEDDAEIFLSRLKLSIKKAVPLIDYINKVTSRH